MTTIRTTHAGSLHRPGDLIALLVAQEAHQDTTGLESSVVNAVNDVVRAQAEAGIDLMGDGEMGKPGYANYAKTRLTGLDGEEGKRWRSRDLDNYPDFGQVSDRNRSQHPVYPACTGPVAYKSRSAVDADIANLKSAASAAGVSDDRLFMTAASPGVIAQFFENRYYQSREEYLSAIVDAMREEYRAIVDAGIILQLDCPDFAMSYSTATDDSNPDEIRNNAHLALEALNAATEGIDSERMRTHICWGNAESPHAQDIELKEIISVILAMRPAGISLAACNPRHAHEWQLFEHVALPADKYLIPGVIDPNTNFVEHPELVAQRILNYVRIVGPDRVIAGTDCGFGTTIARDRVAGTVAWAKLRSMVEGARIASIAV